MTTMQRTGPKASGRVRTDPLRRTALVVGWLFVITYVTSIASKFAFYPPLFEGDYITGSGADTQLRWGALSELVLIVANVGTAVALFSVLRRQNQNLAIGYVTARVMESVFIAVGILSVLTVVTVREDHAGAGDAASAVLTPVGDALVALQEWTFVLGPGFVVGIGNGLILGYLMYRSGLVPRGMAMLGLVGGPLICISGAAVVLGVIEAGSVWQNVATIPEFFWELSLGVYLIVKGFRPSPITAGMS
jgi:Domain of unknown function (DUF4386)